MNRVRISPKMNEIVEGIIAIQAEHRDANGVIPRKEMGIVFRRVDGLLSSNGIYDPVRRRRLSALAYSRRSYRENRAYRASQIARKRNNPRMRTQNRRYANSPKGKAGLQRRRTMVRISRLENHIAEIEKNKDLAPRALADAKAELTVLKGHLGELQEYVRALKERKKAIRPRLSLKGRYRIPK